jgi:O-antigen/teichoic acid export membrane protein
MAEPSRERSLSSETIGNSLRTAIATAINALTSAASTIIIVRALGPAIYGRYTFFGILIALVLGLSDLGFNSRGLSVLVRAEALGDMAAVVVEIRRLLIIGLCRAIVIGATAAVVFHNEPVAGLLVGLGIMLQALCAGLSISLVARRRYRILTASSVAFSLTQSIATSWVAITTHDPALTVGAFFASQLVTAAVAAVFAPWRLITHARRKVQPRQSRPEFRTILAFYISVTCQIIIFGQSETIILHYDHQAIALGFFAIATTLSARATLLTDALYGALLPSLGSASIRDSDGITRAYSAALRFSSLLVLLTTALLGPVAVVIGPIVLGSHAGSVRVATVITLGASLLQTFVYPLAYVAAVETQRAAIAIPALLGALFDAGLSILLIPHYGLFGAAAASLVGGLAFGLSVSLMTRIPPGAKMALRSQLIRVLVMIAVLVISGIATEHAGVGVALGVMWISVLSVYMACRFGHGVLTTTDIDRVRAAEHHWPITLSARTWRVAVLLLLVTTHASIAHGTDA